MSAVRVEETTAVCSPFLDDFLGSDRPLCDRLFRYSVHHWFAIGTNYGFVVGTDLLDLHRLDQGDLVVRAKVLNDASCYQEQSSHHAKGQQDP